MYSTNLIKSIQTKINSATTSEEVMLLSKVIEKLNVGAVKIVSTYSALSSIFPVIGSVYFVEDEENLVYYSSVGWIKINKTLNLPILTWGSASQGQLGDGTAVNKSSPVSVVGGFSDWVQISGMGSGNHGLGLRTNGTAWAWGGNAFGQLGDGTITSRSSPVSVIGGFADWTSLQASSNHSLGLRSDGTAWAWGGGGAGGLGDNTVISKSSPVLIVGGFTDWVQLVGAANNSLGIRSDGTAWAWGGNSTGNLGDGTTTAKSSPVSVLGGFTDWVQLAGGNTHGLGIRQNGTAWAWGRNNYGQLGDGTTVNKSSPVSVVGGFTDWIKVDGGFYHSLGLRSNGTAWSWGNNSSGQLGDGTTVSKSSPVSVVGGVANWTQVSAGQNHSVALRSDGTAAAWGLNTQGQLGDGTAVAKSSPVSVVGGFTDWIRVECTGGTTIAIRSVQ